MIWGSTLQIQNYGCFSDLEFITLFVNILSLYAINLSDVSLFADSSFTFLVMGVPDYELIKEFKNKTFVLKI